MVKTEHRELLNRYLVEHESAKEWVSKGQYASNIGIFLKWIARTETDLGKLTKNKFEKFTAYLVERQVSVESRWKVRNQVWHFLNWLHLQDYPIPPADRIVPWKKPRACFVDVDLPNSAVEFLELMKTTLKPTTLGSHKTALKHFYNFLRANELTVKALNRQNTEKYFSFLTDLNQAPTTRIGNIVIVRKYLRWHFDHGRIKQIPEFLIRTEDFPKKPDYLPRPLSVEIDRTIQERLIASKDINHRALLLMRWTGLRVGELANLSKDCLHRDSHGNSFLKVPLGKLNNERMVPLDKATLKLIGVIQKQADEMTQGKRVSFLIPAQRAKKVTTHALMFAFKEVTEDIKSVDPIVSHRLRHTFATQLLGAGMNIFALRDILGHRDIAMTLRYAAVTQEKLREEYFAALKRLEDQNMYQEQILSNVLPGETNFSRMLQDLTLELRRQMKAKRLPSSHHEHLKRRIALLRKEIESLIK